MNTVFVRSRLRHMEGIITATRKSGYQMLRMHFAVRYARSMTRRASCARRSGTKPPPGAVAVAKVKDARFQLTRG